MAQTLDQNTDLNIDQAATLLSGGSSTHPPVALPAGAFPALDSPMLGFAPAPAAPTDLSAPSHPADRPAPPVRPQSRLHLGWDEAAVFTLILSCAALCIYRLLWAVQP